MRGCIFCNIVAGRADASIVYRDSECLAMMDIRPINAGHVLVIPVEHASNLAELKPAVGAAVFKVAQRVAAAIRRSTLKPDGINLLLADGEAAGQEVFHVHLHVLPRFRGDGFGHTFPAGYGREPSRAELDQTAAIVTASLGPGGNAESLS